MSRPLFLNELFRSICNGGYFETKHYHHYFPITGHDVLYFFLLYDITENKCCSFKSGGGGIYVIFHIMCMQITLPVTRGTHFKRNIFL